MPTPLTAPRCLLAPLALALCLAGPAVADEEPVLAGLRYPARWATGVSVGDLDGDGHADLVVDHGVFGFGSPAGGLSVLRGRGQAGFDLPRFLEGVDVDVFPSFVRLLDANGDDVPDLLILQNGAPGHHVRLGVGDGTFGPAIPFAGKLNAYDANVVAVADLDGDGLDDVVARGSVGSVIGGTSHPVILAFRSQGDGSLAVSGGANEQWFEGYWSLALGDVDGDGIVDLVLNAQYGDAYLRVHRGVGDGSFEEALPGFGQGLIAWSMTLADLDGDDVLDLVTLGAAADDPDMRLRVFAGRGDATFEVPTVLDLVEPARGPARRVLALDVDGDGALDLVSVVSGVDGVTVHAGRGDGSFEAPRLFRVSRDLPVVSFQAAEPADLDGDGNADVVVVEMTSGVHPMRGGDGAFTELGLSLRSGGKSAALSGSGTSGPGDPVTLHVAGDPQGAAGVLVVGLRSHVAAWQGGLLGPVPAAFVPVVLGATLETRWPAGLPSGSQAVLQAWFGAGSDVWASNVLVVTDGIQG